MSNKTILALEPWLLPLAERKRIFLEAKRAGKKIALYYSKAPDSSTFRYRVYNTFQATQQSKKWQAVFFSRSEAKTISELLPQSDIFILGRQSRWDNLISELTDLAHQHKINVVFDLDDLVFDKKFIPLVMNTIGETNIEYWIPYFSDIHSTSEHCDSFLVTNDFLGSQIQSCFDKPYIVIPNSLNDEQVIASRIYAERKLKLREPDHFILGYFSGSPTHTNDLEVIFPEVLEFLKLHSDTIFEVVGLMNFNEAAKPFLKNGQIRLLPPVDFRKLQRRMAAVDVNLAPLVNNDFTNCKSELKFFEAAAVETTTIASPTFAFKQAIQDGKTGFLARPGEWLDKLEYLYKHPAENRQIALAAKDYCLKTYYGPHFLKTVESAYDSLAK